MLLPSTSTPLFRRRLSLTRAPLSLHLVPHSIRISAQLILITVIVAGDRPLRRGQSRAANRVGGVRSTGGQLESTEARGLTTAPDREQKAGRPAGRTGGSVTNVRPVEMASYRGGDASRVRVTLDTSSTPC